MSDAYVPEEDVAFIVQYPEQDENGEETGETAMAVFSDLELAIGTFGGGGEVTGAAAADFTWVKENGGATLHEADENTGEAVGEPIVTITRRQINTLY